MQRSSICHDNEIFLFIKFINLKIGTSIELNPINLTSMEMIMKIVCIGGGHGLAQVLQTFKDSDHHVSAIVTTTDNGGSTGKLRKDPSQIAFGDIRRCICTLANPNNMLNMMSQQRFELSNDLKDHSMGNIMLTSLNQLASTPSEAIKWFSAMLDVKQTILPMSDQPVDLIAMTPSGKTIFGECAVDALDELPKALNLSSTINAVPEAIELILDADVVLIGPGSLLTSVLPPLLIPAIQDALSQSAACRIYIENLVSEESVMAKIPHKEHATWACDLIGYQFFDISLSADALFALDLRTDADNFDQEINGVHCERQLKHVLETFFGSKKSHTTTSSTNNQVH